MNTNTHHKESANNITMIPIAQLIPHPQNPRKSLGDLTELADSIRANGIYQNLTVVPNPPVPDSFTVIIGHRRLAAAKAAGLDKVPCAIVKMTDKQQLETMLLENMQRADLTVLEEAQGLQLLIDLGDDVASLSKSTGFSKKTIKNRLLLNAYDPDSVTKAFDRGATLEDYVKLAKIQDPNLRDKVAVDLGTSNFAYALDKALKKEKWANEKEKCIELLLSAGAEEGLANWRDQKARKYAYNLKDVQDVIAAADGRSIKYRTPYAGADYLDIFILYREDEKPRETTSASSPQPDPARERANYLDRYIDLLGEDFGDYIENFISELSDPPTSASGQIKVMNSLIYLVLRYLIETDDSLEISSTYAFSALNIVPANLVNSDDEVEDDGERRTLESVAAANLMKEISVNPIKYLLGFCWSSNLNEKPAEYRRWSAADCAEHEDDPYLTELIHIMKDLGLELPDELSAYLDGTHRIYTKEGCDAIYAERGRAIGAENG